MKLFGIKKKEINDTEPKAATTEARKDGNISNPTIAEKDLQYLEDMYVENLWLRRKQEIIDCLENNEYIEFDFLEEVVEVEPDGYGGTNKKFYFKEGIFYTRLSHWDGANSFANQSYAHTPIDKATFAHQLSKKKTKILQSLSEEDKNKFEPIFDDIQALLLKYFDKSEVDDVLR